MTNNTVLAAALAARNAKLLLDGAAYRVGIVHTKAAVVYGLRAESLIHSAVEHAVGVAGTRLEALLALTPGQFRC